MIYLENFLHIGKMEELSCNQYRMRYIMSKNSHRHKFTGTLQVAGEVFMEAAAKI